MDRLVETPAEIYSQGHFGVIAPLLMDQSLESILIRGLEPIIVQKSGLYKESDLRIKDDYQLDVILGDVERFSILAGKDDLLSTYILPDGVICQVMHRSHNNPQPILLFELPLKVTPVLDQKQQSYVGEDAAMFLSTALREGLSLFVCGDRERGNVLSGLTLGLAADCTVVNIERGMTIPVGVERELSVNYIASSYWAKMIGPDQVIPLALAYRPQCILIGEIGDINLSAVFTQYSGQLLAGIEATSLDDALAKLQSLLPNWFQQISFDEALARFTKRIPLLIYVSRSGTATPVVESISEVKVLKSSLISRTIYRHERTNPQPSLLRTSSDSNLGRYFATKTGSGEWASSWLVDEKLKENSGSSLLPKWLTKLKRLIA